MERESELFMLAGIGAVIRWIEELASLLAGPILTFGLGIAVLDLLTGGRLLADTPGLLWLWGASQAVGLDAQLVGSAAKLGAAFRRRALWAALGYGVLVCALGYVAFQASNVFGTQQAEGVTTAQALAQLGMDGATWIVERSALAVVLVVLSGLLRYVAPKLAHASIEDERADLQRELELEPLRQALRARQVGGLRTLAEAALRGAEAVPALPSAMNAPLPSSATDGHPTTLPEAQEVAAPASPDTSSMPSEPPSGDRPPTGPGSPAAGSYPRPKNPAPPAVLRLPKPAPEPRRKVAQAGVRTPQRSGQSLEAEARHAWENGARTIKAMRDATGMSKNAAGGWVRTFKAERAASEQQAAQ